MITLDNYKEYLEFFKKEEKVRLKKLNKIIHILGFSFLIAMIQSFISIPLSIVIMTCSSVYCVKKEMDLLNEEQISKEVTEHIKRKYPHINTDIEYTELYKTLYIEGIIKHKNGKLIICEEEYLNKYGIKKEEKKKLEITEENYKGYLEYFKYESIDELKKAGITFGSCLLGIIFLNLIFKNNIIAARFLTSCGAITTIVAMYKVLKNENEKIKLHFEEKYPYLDWERTDIEISKALEKSKIIKFEGSEIVTCEEEFLKEKNITINQETNNKSLIYNQEEKNQKVKIKVK